MDFDLATGLEIVHQSAEREIWQAVGICAASAIALALLFAFVLPLALRVLRRMTKWGRAAFAVAAIGLALYAGTKGTITYPQTDPDIWYLRDNGSGVSNDFVRVNFTRNIIVPTSASFYIDGLEVRYTNASDWVTHSFNAYSNTFADATIPFDLQYAAATNYNWIVYTDWTPSPTVHTNGVAYITWHIPDGGASNTLATMRTGIYTNAVRVAPSPAITNGPPLSSLTLTTATTTQGGTDNE